MLSMWRWMESRAHAWHSDLDYDLLVLDLNLPKLDGISVLRSVRPGKPQLPVLVLTARPRWKTGFTLSTVEPTTASTSLSLIPSFPPACVLCCGGAVPRSNRFWR